MKGGGRNLKKNSILEKICSENPLEKNELFQKNGVFFRKMTISRWYL